MDAGAAKTGLSWMRLGGGEAEELSLAVVISRNVETVLDAAAVGGARKPLMVDISKFDTG